MNPVKPDTLKTEIVIKFFNNPKETSKCDTNLFIGLNIFNKTFYFL